MTGTNEIIIIIVIKKKKPILAGRNNVAMVIAIPPKNQSFPPNWCVALHVSGSSKVHGVRMPTK